MYLNLNFFWCTHKSFQTKVLQKPGKKIEKEILVGIEPLIFYQAG